MRLTGLTATVQLCNPENGEVAELEMFNVEFERIGFGMRGDGSEQHTIFEIHGSVYQNGSGQPKFKKLSAGKPVRKAKSGTR